MALISLLPGKTLQFLSETSAEGVEIATKLVVEAISVLHTAGDHVKDTPIPRRTLNDDLLSVLERGGPWLHDPVVAPRLDDLKRCVEAIKIDLVFSNGDYQPANFLSDGKVLTGLLDFEKAAFVDPLSVLARYPVYDLQPLCDTVVTAFLGRNGFRTRDFASRVAVFCLRTLQTKIPISDRTPKQEAFQAPHS